MRFVFVPWLVVLAAACGGARTQSSVSIEPAGPEREYLVYVASEATDRIALVRFGPAGARVEREITTGIMPTDPDGPHGLAVAADGRHWYTTTAHGTPFGYLWKYTTGNVFVSRVMLGDFPATVQLSPDGEFAWVVNFNLHGEMVPSSVSVVATDEMVEIARITTCTMPHGSRLNPQGTKHYSACMMDDIAVEIDTRSFSVARHFMLTRGREHGMAGAPREHGTREHDAGAHGADQPHAADPGCSPTWAQPSADGARLFVACNKSSDIVELDVAGWSLTRRIPAGEGVYNLAATGDGRLLVATNKRGQSVSIFEIASGREMARLPTKRPVPHGAVISPDDRYAFISVEGIGSEPGTVEVIDLRSLRTVATVDVGQMAGGIDFWRIEPYPHAHEPIGTVRQVYDGALPHDLAVTTFRNIDRLFPSRRIPRAQSPRPLPRAATQLRDVRFTFRDTTYGLHDYVDGNRVAAMLVLKNGRVALETYRFGNTELTRWMSMSMVKSITSTLIGAAIAQGHIGSVNDPVTRYVPALVGTAYEGASIRDVLMMASGVRWDETYTNPASDRRRLLEAQISQVPGAALDVMRRLPRAAEPGTVNNYNTGETQIAAEVLRLATGRTLSEYLAERIWHPIGAEADAYWWLDSPGGVEIGGSGFAATLRDYGRFGQFILNEGRAGGQALLPPGWTREAGTPKVLSDGTPLDYGYLWWTGTSPAARRDGAFSADGIFGQFIYVNPAEQVVIVVWSVWPMPLAGTVFGEDWSFFEAVVDALRER